jgi:hypothetical protein
MRSGTDIAGVEAAPSAGTRRSQYRLKIQNLAYASLDHADWGILRDLSETGVGIQTVTPLRPNQPVELGLDLPNPRARLETTARVAWTGALGQIGLEFVDLDQPRRRRLKDWLFTQVLAGAERNSQKYSPILGDPKSDDEAAELRFSAGSRPAILLPASSRAFPAPRHGSPALELACWPAPISPTTLSRVVDGLVIVAAVLFFCLVSVSATHIFPTWPVALTLVLAVSAVFVLVYRLLFHSCSNGTLGQCLAQLAMTELEDDQPGNEDATRFR